MEEVYITNYFGLTKYNKKRIILRKTFVIYLLKGSYATETEQARIDFERRMIEKAEAARNVLSNITNWMWKCDTPSTDHIENETYIQFTELLQVRPFLLLINSEIHLCYIGNPYYF